MTNWYRQEIKVNYCRLSAYSASLLRTRYNCLSSYQENDETEMGDSNKQCIELKVIAFLYVPCNMSNSLCMALHLHLFVQSFDLIWHACLGGGRI